MNGAATTFLNGPIFDGRTLHQGYAAQFQNGKLAALGLESDLTLTGTVVDLEGDILSPGYVDLQVNGGGGLMLNDDPSVDTIKLISQAHRALGVARLLPTLITDTAEKTSAAIEAAVASLQEKTPGVAGLHLEGPHLSVERKGAHDADLIRPMEGRDLDMLLDAAKRLPVLKVTIAPENVTEAQVQVLADAGVLVSLGHTDADFDTCTRYFEAGASCVTHLFNAMSPLANRDPGLVGAALSCGAVSAGLIADAIHVHPNSMRVAWDAKVKPGRIFLVSDSMAVAGTEVSSFELGGRTITRNDNRLTLSNGTLAGADLDLTTAVSVLVNKVGVTLEEALAAATSVPAALCGLQGVELVAGQCNLRDMIRIRSDLTGIKPTFPE